MTRYSANDRTIRKGARRGRRQADEGLDLVPPVRPATALQRWGPILMVAALVFIVYIPTYDNEFVSWDDDHYIFANHQVHYWDGIRSIWFDVFHYSDAKFRRPDKEWRVSHQYYPLVFTLYWIEFRFHEWINDADPEKTIQENIEDGKMTAMSFHVVNVVLHAVNVMILIMFFRALGLSNWVAWAATLLFAIHPLQVATVAWAAERKNIISLMFYLLSLMVYIRMRRQQTWGRYLLYVLSLVLFQAALFSKTVALTLPVMLFFTDRLLERRWVPELVLKSIARALPFVVLSGIAAWTTINVEDRDRTIPLSESQRPFVPAAALLFYPQQMLVPVNQSPVYPLWDPDPTDFRWFLPTLIVMLLGLLVIVFRRRLGPHFMWALLFYIVTQGPMLGFKNINYFQFAFVAEHYFYHGSVGLFLMLALGINWLRLAIKPEKRGFNVATSLVCIAAAIYGTKTWFYNDVWQNAESFWKRTIEMNPECWPAWYNTANARRREAQDLFEKARPLVQEANALRKEAQELKAQAKDLALPTASSPEAERLLSKAEELEKEAGRKTDSARDLSERANKLLDDAAERYVRVTEIHKKINQPFDQWIAVRTLQRDWAGALEAAAAAAARFEHIVKYHVLAGQFAQRAGRTEQSVIHYTNAGRLQARYGDASVKKRQACDAATEYQEALGYLRNAYQQDRDNAELVKTINEVQEKYQQAKQSCPEG